MSTMTLREPLKADMYKNPRGDWIVNVANLEDHHVSRMTFNHEKDAKEYMDSFNRKLKNQVCPLGYTYVQEYTKKVNGKTIHVKGTCKRIATYNRLGYSAFEKGR